MAPAKANEETPEAPEATEEWGERVPELPPTHDPVTEGVVIGQLLGTRSIDVEGRSTTIHDLMTDDGMVGVWGSTVLDRKLLGLNGQMVRIEFQGLGESSGKGKNAPKLFDVQHRKV